MIPYKWFSCLFKKHIGFEFFFAKYKIQVSDDYVLLIFIKRYFFSLDFEIPIYVWIYIDAASAGALISIACDSIYMSSGASIGAATVVTGDGTQAPDKSQSYMR